MNTYNNNSTKDFLIDEVLRDYSNNSKDTDLLKQISILRHDKIEEPVIYVGSGTCGLGAGAGKTLEAVKKYITEKNIKAKIIEAGCIGLCAVEPIIDIQLPEYNRISFQNITEDKAEALLDSIFQLEIPQDDILGQFRTPGAKAWEKVKYLDEHPFFAPQKRLVLKNCGVIDPSDIKDYIARGGYKSYIKAINIHTPGDICDIIEKSGLRGRGGGGFPTGRKWKFANAEKSDQKYLICNADEGDPGAFMDRAVIEGDPHRLIEGMAIGAYAIGATLAYIYIRAEYPLAIRRLETAIEQAKEYGLVGKNIFETGVDFEIKIKKGAGAFVCGEETALMHSIEGKRGMPRPRPPFPTTSGLFGKPSVINNVETFANVSDILANGADWFASTGTENSKGTKVFALSGKIALTGLVEIPMGTTVRKIIFDIAGGIINNKKFKAVQIGGPSGGCITEDNLDIQIDYESLIKVGAMMGSGGLVVMDENTCMVDVAKFFMGFIQSESCGKCIPCREGTKRLLEILESITSRPKGNDNTEALDRFKGMMQVEKLSRIIKDTSLCGLGQTAPNPVLSTYKWFKDEYEAHVFDRRCPAGTCSDLVGVACQNNCPVGTEAWRYVAEIARGDYAGAYRTIRQANPFPSVCARVCDHPCESVCKLGTTGGEPIAIRSLKRFVVEKVDPSVYKTVVNPAKEEAAKVAVIGAGPSGLTAAHYLSLQGYKVTIFEKEKIPGGMLTCAIPEYRLPREKLNKEIDSLLNDNIELKCNEALGKTITIDSLLKEEYKAVYLAIGSHKSLSLGLKGENASGIMPGLDFLKAYNLEGKTLAKGKVGIIGGGNSAIDAARVAFRQKDVESVTVFYRRTENEMPAYKEEIEAALEEGIEIKSLVAPTKVIQKDGVLQGMEFIQNSLEGKDSSGRPRPVPLPGSEFLVELDTLIVAISEQPESEYIGDLNSTKWGTLLVDKESLLTSQKGVFGGGDIVTGPDTVIEAIAAGKKAAFMVERYLKGKSLRMPQETVIPEVFIEPLETDTEEESISTRAKAPMLPVGEREGSFAEVELALSEKDAICEARRCLRCDLEYTQPIEIETTNISSSSGG